MASQSEMIALTHFSVRLEKSMKIIDLNSYKNSNIQKYTYSKNKTFIAHDHLQVQLNNMKQLPYLTRKMEHLN